MKLLLIRHGSTLANEQHTYAGQLDVPLSPLGEQQVAHLGLQLASTAVEVIITSPLQRARATAAAIAPYHTVPTYEDAALRELSYGCWEGETQLQVKARFPDLLRCWKQQPTQCQIPDGETLPQLHTRVMKALRHWYQHYPHGEIIWVTHTGVIRVVLCQLNRVDLDQWRLFRPENASVATVTVSPADLLPELADRVGEL